MSKSVLFKKRDALIADISIKETELDKFALEMEKGMETLPREEYDLLAEQHKTVTDELENLKTELDNEKMAIQEEMNSRQKALSTATANNIVARDENITGRKDFLEAYAKAVRGDATDYNKFVSTADDSAGLLIPTELQNHIERAVKDYGTLLNHANVTSIKSMLKIPIEVTATEAKFYDEGAEVDEEVITLAEILIDPKSVKKYITWTNEIEVMSAVDLMAYLATEFIEKIIIAIEREMLFGLSETKGMYGVVTEAKSNAGKGTSRVKPLEVDAINFKLGFTIPALIRGRETKYFMNKSTYYGHIAPMVNDNGTPLYGTNVNGQPLFNGTPVEFLDELVSFDEAVEGDAVIIAQAKDTYRVNAPKGLAPQFVRDPYTGLRKGTVGLMGEVFVGGRASKFDGTVVVLKGK